MTPSCTASSIPSISSEVAAYASQSCDCYLHANSGRCMITSSSSACRFPTEATCTHRLPGKYCLPAAAILQGNTFLFMQVSVIGTVLVTAVSRAWCFLNNSSSSGKAHTATASAKHNFDVAANGHHAPAAAATGRVAEAPAGMSTASSPGTVLVTGRHAPALHVRSLFGVATMSSLNSACVDFFP